jgi:2-amino-4-hydroxy-6-hydroxymethyldihydropteridine diphosphokinase
MTTQKSHTDPTTVYLGLGSNLGDRRRAMEEAIRRLAESGVVADVVASSLYETEAVAPEPQPAYLNAVVRGRTILSAGALLARCLEIERELGRVRPSRTPKAPRTIDIDVLLFGDAVIQTPDLIVPHPRLLDRLFVLVPLADVADPSLRHPLTGVTLATAASAPSVRKVIGQKLHWAQ